MLALVLLSAVLGQNHRQPPDVVVKAIDDSRLRVLVRPLGERTVKSVALEPAKKTKSARHEPHTRITLPPTEGVCFTFTPIPEPFDVIVTLSDATIHRVGKKGWKDSNSTPRYRVVSIHGEISQTTCF